MQSAIAALKTVILIIILFTATIASIARADEFGSDFDDVGLEEESGGPIEEELEESFVLFQVKKIGDGFYRVMMDWNETPYFDLENVAEWIELNLDCQKEKSYCQLVVHPDPTVYWVDWENNKMGNSRDGETIKLDARALGFKEDKLWVRWDVMEKWLDVSTRWNLKHYHLTIIPHYKLVRERKAEREKQRMISLVRAKEREKMKSINAVEAPPGDAVLLRYALNASQGASGATQKVVTYEMGSDIFGGFLRASGSRNLEAQDDSALTLEEQGDDELQEAIESVSVNSNVFDYVNYSYVGHPLFHNLELGNTRYPSAFIVPAVGLSSGVLLQRNEYKQGLGTFEKEGKTEPNTEIEIFINGFFQEVIFSDDNGQYVVEERFVSGGDTISLKFYFEDGREEVEYIDVANDSSLILDKGDFDYTFSHGNTDVGRFTNVTFRYGLLTDNSFGVSFTQWPFRDSVDDVDTSGLEESAYNTDTVIGFDYSVRPIYGLSVLMNAARHSEGVDFEIRSYVSLFENQSVSFFAQSYNEQSPLKLGAVSPPPGNKIFGANYGFRYAKHNVDALITRVDDFWSAETRYTYRYSRNLYATLASDLEQTIEQNNIENEIVLGYSTEKWGSHEFSITEETQGWSGRWAGGVIKGWNEKVYSVPWLITTDLRKSTNSDTLWKVSGSLKYSNSLAVAIELEEQGIGLRFNWRDGVVAMFDRQADLKDAFSFGRIGYREFNGAIVDGYVYMPPDEIGEEPSEPLSRVEVAVAGARATTDDDGYFRVSNVIPHTKVKFSVIQNSLDATVAYGEKDKYFLLRPGTRIRYNPPIVWTSGLDGAVYAAFEIPSGTVIRAIDVDTETIVASGGVEPDGFFMLEGLTPGKYLLEVLAENPPPKFPLTIDAGVDWVSDVIVPWGGDDANFEDDSADADGYESDSEADEFELGEQEPVVHDDVDYDEMDSATDAVETQEQISTPLDAEDTGDSGDLTGDVGAAPATIELPEGAVDTPIPAQIIKEAVEETIKEGINDDLNEDLNEQSHEIAEPVAKEPEPITEFEAELEEPVEVADEAEGSRDDTGSQDMDLLQQFKEAANPELSVPDAGISETLDAVSETVEEAIDLSPLPAVVPASGLGAPAAETAAELIKALEEAADSVEEPTDIADQVEAIDSAEESGRSDAPLEPPLEQRLEATNPATEPTIPTKDPDAELLDSLRASEPGQAIEGTLKGEKKNAPVDAQNPVQEPETPDAGEQDKSDEQLIEELKQREYQKALEKFRALTPTYRAREKQLEQQREEKESE